MLTVEEALKAVIEHAKPLPPVRRSLDQALGLILAEDAVADRDQPPFDKALMDGYAVRSEDFRNGPISFRVVEEITAGKTPTRDLGFGEAASIMTGAPMPQGADAVIMFERARAVGDSVVSDEPVSSGQNRLAQGAEIRAGEAALPSGSLLEPVRIGVLASIGRAEVPVVPRPRVAVVSTGDELVEPNEIPGPGQIRNSNAAMLRALIVRWGADPIALRIARDDMGELTEILAEGLQADALLISGGVSAGRRDLTPSALTKLGVKGIFHQIRLKPGKPLWFGIGPDRPGRDDERDGATPGPAPGTLVFGLPGNPVSSLVGFLLFVRPALDLLGQRPATRPALLECVLASPFAHRGERPTYHPAKLAPAKPPSRFPEAVPLDWIGSADLRTVASADGFVVFPPGDRDYPAGWKTKFLPL